MEKGGLGPPGFIIDNVKVSININTASLIIESEQKMNHQEIFNHFDQHLCDDEKPSLYFEDFFRNENLTETFPFKLLAGLRYVEQSIQHHPEGNVWKHTLLVVDCAAERKHLSQRPRILMWAAMLHDLGKVPATKVRKGRITAYDHDKMGEELAVAFLKELTDDEAFVQQVAKMVRWHMQILFVVKHLPFADLSTMVKEVPIEEIALLSLCDRLGRGGMTEQVIQKEYENARHFLNQCRQETERQLQRV